MNFKSVKNKILLLLSLLVILLTSTAMGMHEEDETYQLLAGADGVEKSMLEAIQRIELPFDIQTFINKLQKLAQFENYKAEEFELLSLFDKKNRSFDLEGKTFGEMIAIFTKIQQTKDPLKWQLGEKVNDQQDRHVDVSDFESESSYHCSEQRVDRFYVKIQTSYDHAFNIIYTGTKDQPLNGRIRRSHYNIQEQYIQFEPHSKLYLLREDWDSESEEFLKQYADVLLAFEVARRQDENDIYKELPILCIIAMAQELIRTGAIDAKEFWCKDGIYHIFTDYVQEDDRRVNAKRIIKKYLEIKVVENNINFNFVEDISKLVNNMLIKPLSNQYELATKDFYSIILDSEMQQQERKLSPVQSILKCYELFKKDGYIYQELLDRRVNRALVERVMKNPTAKKIDFLLQLEPYFIAKGEKPKQAPQNFFVYDNKLNTIYKDADVFELLLQDPLDNKQAKKDNQTQQDNNTTIAKFKTNTNANKFSTKYNDMFLQPETNINYQSNIYYSDMELKYLGKWWAKHWSMQRQEAIAAGEIPDPIAEYVASITPSLRSIEFSQVG